MDKLLSIITAGSAAAEIGDVSGGSLMTIQNSDDAVTLNESSQQSADMQQTEYNKRKRSR